MEEDINLIEGNMMENEADSRHVFGSLDQVFDLDVLYPHVRADQQSIPTPCTSCID